MNKYRIKKVQVDKDTSYYYPQVRFFFFWQTMKKQIIVENDYEYFIEEVSSKCSTYQEAVEIIQNDENMNGYPRVEYLEVKAPIMPVDSKKIESNI